MLANKKKDIFGIKVDLYQTKDNVFILLDDELKTKLVIDNLYIKNHTYKEIKKLKFGTKVKKHSLITLNDLINITNDKKNIILKITENINFSDLKNIINNNKKINWHIYSSSLDILNKLLIENIKCNIGIYINNIEDLTFSFDFYVIDKNMLDNVQINEKLKVLNKVFISNISSKKEKVLFF